MADLQYAKRVVLDYYADLDALLQGNGSVDDVARDSGKAGDVDAVALVGSSFDDARTHTEDMMRQSGRVYVPPFDDPDLTDAAARLARDRAVPATAQAEFAVASHAKAGSPSVWLCPLFLVVSEGTRA